MAVTYTNRMGIKHHLYESRTKSGAVRYVFARVPKGPLVKSLPKGYEIRENVNGLVSLAKATPKVLNDIEVASVKRAVRRHPEAKNYRVEAKGPRITVFENIGPSADTLAGLMGLYKGLTQRAKDFERDLAQFSPVIRFVLVDKEARLFNAERICYHIAVDGWLTIEYECRLDELVERLIPLLGTDEFFRLR